MRKALVVHALFLLITASCFSQATKLSNWPGLIDSHNREAAQQLCTRYVNSADISERVEAQKCLANVALLGNDVVQLQGDDSGGGTLSGGYTAEAVDKSLVHLNIALKLAPQDLSIHQGRLHVLEASGRYLEMIKALDESCSIYKGSDALDAWLAYASELDDLRQYQAGLAFMKVLDKHYPNTPDVVGNIGAFLSLLQKPADAIPYLQRAVELAPTDPINAWDLGKAYDLTDQVKLADTWYQKGLSLQSDKKQFSESSCLYGHFIEQKLHNRERACSLEKMNCDADDQTACGTAPLTKTPN